MDKIINVVQSGTCLCVEAPNCDGGLEGYNEKTEYKFELVRMEQDIKKKGLSFAVRITHYYRIYIDEAYSTCGVGIFKRYFEVVNQTELLIV